MRMTAATLLLAVSTAACGIFTIQEPYERWEIVVSYVEEGRRVVAEPERVEVHGPRGEIRINNSTPIKRGFRIKDLGVAAEIDDDESARLPITGVQDGETYAFGDHLNRGGPRGEIVVDYVRRN